MIHVILVIFYVFAPLLILYLCHRFPFINKLGAVVVAYMVGLILGNIGVLPEGSEKIQEWVTTITVPLAIPLLLFSINIKNWFRIAGKTMLSMILALSSIIIIVILGNFLFQDSIDESWKISGMLVGVYSGGTPNLASIQAALDVDKTVYIITHTYDMILSAIYLFFLMIAGQKVFGLILPRFKKRSLENEIEDLNGTDPYWGMLQKEKALPLLKALVYAIIVFASGAGLSFLVPEESQMVVVILTITTLGIAGSFVPGINKIDKTFELGMYFILIFSIVVASMADISKFTNITPSLFFYVTLAVFGSLVLHILFSKFFAIDADTTIITSTALICSPPFVPVVAGALKNKEIIVSGLTVGIIGYAVGNYLGITMGYLLR